MSCGVTKKNEALHNKQGRSEGVCNGDVEWEWACFGLGAIRTAGPSIRRMTRKKESVRAGSLRKRKKNTEEPSMESEEPQDSHDSLTLVTSIPQFWFVFHITLIYISISYYFICFNNFLQ